MHGRAQACVGTLEGWCELVRPLLTLLTCKLALLLVCLLGGALPMQALNAAGDAWAAAAVQL
jgi:hypothetical protein